MINGFDISSWETITDIQAVINDKMLMDFAYIRAHDGYRDDEKFPQFRALMRTAHTANGSVLWGPYMFLGYSGVIGSRSWNAVRGDLQAQNCWDLATGGGREFPLPVAIDCEKIRWWDGANFQIVPLPVSYTYCDNLLVPAIEFLTEKMGRRPVLYSNADFILNYLQPQLAKAEFSIIGECPLWLASWTSATGTMPPYMSSIIAKTPWKSFLIHQYAGDVSQWPGINAIDLNRGVGTRVMWKAWIADATKLPVEGGVEPPPPPVDPPPPETPDLTAILARLDALESHLETVEGNMLNHEHRVSALETFRTNVKGA